LPELRAFAAGLPRHAAVTRPSLRLVNRDGSLRARLAELDLRRRRAQIAARHAIDSQG
jgi:hypothetical protein